MKPFDDPPTRFLGRVIISSLCSLKWSIEATINDQRQRIWNVRSELEQRLLAQACEYCGSTDHVQVHHIRALKDLEKYDGRAKPAWGKIMAARHRKTLVLCRTCHHDVHAGRPMTRPSSRSRKEYDAREPGALKGACQVCAVRRFEISLSETGGTKEVFLSYQLTWRRKPNGTRACWASGAYLKTL